MKTTKKRLLLGIAGAAMLCTGAAFTTLAATANPQITDETMLANIEALSSGEAWEYPDGISTQTTCGTNGCTTTIVYCSGGGSGCSTRKCSVHKN